MTVSPAIRRSGPATRGQDHAGVLVPATISPTHQPFRLRNRFFTFAAALLMLAAAVLPNQAAAAPAQGVQTPSGWVDLSPGEQRLLDAINWTRSQAGLGQLTLDATVVRVARDRSADMANRGYFAHRTPEGKGFLDFLRQWGVNYRMAGEIIAQNNYPTAESPDEAHRGFLRSAPHRQIIMMNNWTQVGIGQAVNGNGMYYYTVLFIQPRTNGN